MKTNVMKTNLLKITAWVRVPAEWDAERCNSLRADPNGRPAPTRENRNHREPLPPGPIDTAVGEALGGLADKLAAIDAEIELVQEVRM